jgi:hypothetical protein
MIYHVRLLRLTRVTTLFKPLDILTVSEAIRVRFERGSQIKKRVAGSKLGAKIPDVSPCL